MERCRELENEKERCASERKMCQGQLETLTRTLQDHDSHIATKVWSGTNATSMGGGTFEDAPLIRLLDGLTIASKKKGEGAPLIRLLLKIYFNCLKKEGL